MADISEPFDEFRLELVDVLADDDDRVVTRVRATGASPTFELEWGAIYTFRTRR